MDNNILRFKRIVKAVAKEKGASTEQLESLDKIISHIISEGQPNDEWLEEVLKQIAEGGLN